MINTLQKYDKQTVKIYCKTKIKKNYDMENPHEYLLAMGYYYARLELKLTDYEAKSFSNNLASILTQDLILDSGVELVYNEIKLDDKLFRLYNETGKDENKFFEALSQFYKSGEIKKYEKKMHRFNFKVTEEEAKVWYDIPYTTLNDKLKFLLENYNPAWNNTVIEHRYGDSRARHILINLNTTTYEQFYRTVEGVSRTDRFLKLLYCYKESLDD